MNLSDLPTTVPGRPRKTRLALRDFLLACLDAQSESVRAIQVGANDGKMDDPIWRYWSKEKWTGVLIEPHPIYFSELESLHGQKPNVTLVKAAVSESEGTMTLYHLDERLKDHCPAWLRGCASMEKSRMERAVRRANKRSHLEIPEDAIVGAEVPTRRLEDILSDLKVQKVDLFVVDVEGHEVSVLNSVDFSSLEAKVAVIECNEGNPEDRQAIVSALKAAGMISYKIGNDIVGLRPNVITIPIEAMFHFENMVPLAVEKQPVPTQ